MGRTTARFPFMQFLLERHAIRPQRETIPARTTCRNVNLQRQTKAEPVMSGRTTESSQTNDNKTSRSICDAVGERLQQSLRPEASRLSPHLQHLMDELRKRDGEDFRRTSN
jgi:hypothetical protein